MTLTVMLLNAEKVKNILRWLGTAISRLPPLQIHYKTRMNAFVIYEGRIDSRVALKEALERHILILVKNQIGDVKYTKR